ncbi:MAG TPA: xylose isomerase [Ilumatobacteraceae bacterium]|nr:xylose isomerase [Ilumatobacteraceae bacterium]
MTDFFVDVDRPVSFAGVDSGDGLGYRIYDPDRIVAGKRMEDQLRIAVCYWHSFNWPGSDVFGEGTFDRPWLDAVGDPIEAAFAKQDAAFEFFTKLGTPFYCFHDVDMAPEGATLRESEKNLARLVERAAQKQAETGVRLLWGTANVFSHRRFAAGAATNPNPEMFAYAAAQVRNAMRATHELGGANYVLWGGREGYETLLNTDMRKENDHLARFLELVAEYKRSIGFAGQLLLEPKPQEPTKHQYDYDSATVHGFLDRYDLLDEYRVNIEVNHATLAGHSFHHEVAYALDNGVFGSVDANRGDPQNGWDTDQFPNSVDELSLALFEILRHGGLQQGGFNFDTKLRRQSMDRTDLFHGHIGGIDTLAQSLLVAEALIADGTLEAERAERYSGWESGIGRLILAPGASLDSIAEEAIRSALDPQPVSGRQEYLENQVNAVIWETT